MKQKFLTKTVFKKSLNCPTSVYYYSKKEQYMNNEDGNEFMKSLAEGGYQVEYLAKDYYPQGIDMKDLDFETNVNETRRLMEEEENVVLFEPLFIIDGFLVRVDILEKQGDTIKIFEVKAKGFDFTSKVDKKTEAELPQFTNFLNSRSKTPKLTAAWEEYVYDVAFQEYVIGLIYPEKTIESYLFMLDKNAQASVDGLHQKYLVRKDNTVEVKEGSIGEPIMNQIYLGELFNVLGVFSDDYKLRDGKNFADYIDWIQESYVNETKILTGIGNKCSKCPFYVKEDTTKDSKKNGYLECWEKYTNQPKEYILNNPTVLDIWNYRSKDKLISEDVFFINETQNSETFTKAFEKHEEQIDDFKLFDAKLRQLTQVHKVRDNDSEIEVFEDELRNEMEEWKFPINMIDFETSASALPFSIHVKSYESIAFQFSHHVIHEDGRVEHKSDYLHTEAGGFPSFDFIRALKKSLEDNDGSIFMYSPHENSILNHILRQLHLPIGELEKDRQELIDFIKKITKSNDRTIDELNEIAIQNGEDAEINHWVGERCMIDLWDVQKKLYYNPKTNGSNSIKYVLPAVLESSEYLKNKYSKPIYGTDEIHSCNFKNITWLKFDDDGKVINPYKQLPPLYTHNDNVYTATSVANGGEAMTAYAKLQFTQMDDKERQSIIDAMLKYCELDTLAMVMIWEHWWYDILGNKN